MEFAAQNIIRESFTRNGIQYDCMIAPKQVAAECNRFNVVMISSTENRFSTFDLEPAGDGHWKPDNTSLVDPWLADIIGNYIVDNF
jgi:hypothetical protein